MADCPTVEVLRMQPVQGGDYWLTVADFEFTDPVPERFRFELDGREYFARPTLEARKSAGSTWLVQVALEG